MFTDHDHDNDNDHDCRSDNYEALFRRWRARARAEPETAAGLPGAFLAGESDRLGPHGRQVADTLSAALPLAVGDRALYAAAGSPAPPPGLARSAALLAATEAVGLLGSRAIHCLTAELSIVSAVTPGLVRRLVGSVLSELGAAPLSHPPDESPGRSPLADQFPRLVRGFAAGSVDRGGLAGVAELGGPLPAVQPGALAAGSRRGCSLVQQLPALLAGLEEEGAPCGVVGPARELVAAADRLHWRLAEAGPADTGPARDYELLYAGAASLALWSRTGELWVRATLGELLAPLVGADPAPEARSLLASELLDRHRSGRPLTPFGGA